MFRKMLLLALSTASFAALAMSGAAFGSWTKDGIPINEMTLEGTVKFSSTGLASVHCSSVTAKLLVTPGTTKGHITSFTPNSPTTSCFIGDIIGELCGEESLESMKLTKSASATIVSGAIEITGLELLNIFGKPNEPCLALEMLDGEEALMATPDNAEAMNAVTLSGFVGGGEFGDLKAAGTLSVTPAEIYGTE
jgi:hypothetical protein